MTKRAAPREFWITVSRCTGKTVAYHSQDEMFKEVSGSDNDGGDTAQAALATIRAMEGKS